MGSQQLMGGLTLEDQAFLQRTRKGLKRSVVVGWLLTGLAIFSPVLVAVNFDRLWAASGLETLQTSAIRKLHAQNDQLKALPLTTPLEEKLVNRVLEGNKLMETVLRTQLLLAIVVPIGMVLAGILHQGITLLVHSFSIRRYLKIIDTLERGLRLSRG